LEHPVFAMVHAILLGRRGLKSISTILIGILIAIIAYYFTTFSFIIQGIISAVICAFIFFINLQKLWTFIVSTCCLCYRACSIYINQIQNIISTFWQNRLTRPHTDNTLTERF
jgi:hypothetical protein